MSIFGIARGLSVLGLQVWDAASFILRPEKPFFEPRDGAEQLAETEARVEVIEPEDCGLGFPCFYPYFDGPTPPDTTRYPETNGANPTLVRAWIDGYQSKPITGPITAFVDDWDNGRFTITPAHPFAEFVCSFPIPQIPLTVYSTEELEWTVDMVTTDRTAYGPEYTVTCVPRMKQLRQSLIPDDYLVWLWLDAEKRAQESSATTPALRTAVEQAESPGDGPSPPPSGHLLTLGNDPEAVRERMLRDRQAEDREQR